MAARTGPKISSCATVELHRSNDGADVDGFVQGRTYAQSLHARANFRHESFGDALLHQQAGTCAADLSLIEPDAINEALDRAVEIGVVKDDEWRFAAKFE